MAPPSYQVLKRNAHFKLLVDTNSKRKLFTPRTLLYECLQNNYDLVEVVMQRIKTEQNKMTMKSLILTGRACNRELKRVAFDWFRAIGWNQEAFWHGHKHVYETMKDESDSISQYLMTIEEGFYTLHNEHEFHTFLRNFVEGSIISKRKLINILSLFISANSL